MRAARLAARMASFTCWQNKIMGGRHAAADSKDWLRSFLFLGGACVRGYGATYNMTRGRATEQGVERG